MLKPWKEKEWCIPALSGEFVAAMEDVLDLYEAPYNPKRPPKRPKVCMDEKSQQEDTRPSIAAKPGRLGRFDYEYRRNGTRNLFMFYEHQAGFRQASGMWR